MKVGKELRQLEQKVGMLEGKVEELSKKIEAQETEKRIVKIVGLTAEILTIITGIIAIIEILK